MPQNGQYYDNEIENCHYRKIIGLSLVGQTNEYNNLNRIPTEFPSTEHTSEHNKASSNSDGLFSKEGKVRLNGLTNFKYLRFIYNVEPQDIVKQYENVDWKVDITEGLPIQFQQGSKIRMMASIPDRRFDIEALPPSENNFDDVSDYAKDGEDGEEGLFWIPTIEENGDISWKLDNSTYPTDIKIYIIGPKGINGTDGIPSKIFIPSIDEDGWLTWEIYEIGDINKGELPYIKDPNKKSEDWVLYDDFSYKFIFPQGEKGEEGLSGIIWEPFLDSNDNLSWRIFNGTEKEALKIFKNLKGQDVKPNLIPNGRDGVNELYYYITTKPYNSTNENIRLSVNHPFTNLNDTKYVEFKDIVLYQDYSERVVKTEKEAEELFELYKTGVHLKYVYVNETKHYYKYAGKNNNFNTYNLVNNYNNEELFNNTGVFLFNNISRILVYIISKGNLVIIPN